MENTKPILAIKRKQAKKLHKKGWAIRKIADCLGSGTRHVSQWINMSDEELEKDNRGWKKGNPRKYTKEQKKEIKKIRQQLEKEGSFFIGSLVVQRNYNKLHTNNVSKSFVDRTLKEYKLVKTPRKKRKGVSKYMKYPQHTLNKMGKCMMSVDFIGPKYLKGSDDRINFLSCKYIRPRKEGIIKRVEGQTTDEAIRVLTEVWNDNPIPDVLRIDNDSAFGANLSREKQIGSFTLFLLNLGIKPLYVAQRSPWNNGSIEGHNSVFSKKFWNKLRFTDEKEVDVKIKSFNLEYEKYINLVNNNPPLENPEFMDDFKSADIKNKHVNRFKEHEICFLRITRRKGEKGDKKEYGFIDVLKHEIKLPVDLINLFVYCVIDLKKKKLFCYTETKDGNLEEIKRINFKLKNVIY